MVLGAQSIVLVWFWNETALRGEKVTGSKGFGRLLRALEVRKCRKGAAGLRAER